MRRGDIVWAELDPATGSEAGTRRPVVVVSNDGANSMAELLGRGVVTVVPLTTNVSRVYPFQVLAPATRTGLPHDSKAQAEQIRSIDVRRTGAAAGSLDHELLDDLDAAIRLHLAL